MLRDGAPHTSSVDAQHFRFCAARLRHGSGGAVLHAARSRRPVLKRDYAALNARGVEEPEEPAPPARAQKQKIKRLKPEDQRQDDQTAKGACTAVALLPNNLQRPQRLLLQLLCLSA